MGSCCRRADGLRKRIGNRTLTEPVDHPWRDTEVPNPRVIWAHSLVAASGRGWANLIRSGTAPTHARVGHGLRTVVPGYEVRASPSFSSLCFSPVQILRSMRPPRG